MDVRKTIENIRSSCDNYMDPNLFAFLIDDDNSMGTNNILEIQGYSIADDDSYEEKLLKIHKSENIFMSCGMMTFMPIINECDIFSLNDDTIQITQEEFDENCEEQEVFFGILIEKDSDKYQIGIIDLCNCKVGSSFRPVKKSDSGFYKKLDEIISEMIIS